MISAGSEPLQGLAMVRCAVAAIAIPVIAGTGLVKLFHQAVTRDLCQDRSGRNRDTEPVGPCQRPVWTRQFRCMQAIDDGTVRQEVQGGHCPLHGQKAGLQDIELIDLGNAGLSDAEAASFPYGRTQTGPTLCSQFLGIVEVLKGGLGKVCRRNPHGCRDNRPGPGATPGLVETDDLPVVAGTEFCFKCVVGHGDRRGRTALLRP